MADDVVSNIRCGKSVTPPSTGRAGQDWVAEFYDTNIAPNQLRITCMNFSVRDPQRGRAELGAAHHFDNGITSSCAGLVQLPVTTRVDPNMRATGTSTL